MKHNATACPAVIGVAAGVAAFAGLWVWFEADPTGRLLRHLADRRLTPDQRAELAELKVARAAEHDRFLADAATRRAQVQAGFQPDLLAGASTARTVTELGDFELADECLHADALDRDPAVPHERKSRLAAHRAALRSELATRSRRDHLDTLPPLTRARLRIAIYHAEVVTGISEAARRAQPLAADPWPPTALPSQLTGDSPADRAPRSQGER